MQTMKLILLTFFVTLASVRDFGLCDDSAADGKTRECMKEGLMCETCIKAVICEQKDGKLVPNADSAADCKGDFSCDELAGGCVYNGVCRYNDKFHCPRSVSTEKVKYPDPYNCNNFYTCPGKNPATEPCPDDKVFDPKKGDCADKSGDLCKDYPVPLCKENGESGIIAGSNYSYVCLLGFTDDGIEILYPMFNPVDSAPTTSTTQNPVSSTTTTQNPVDPSATTTKVSSSTQPGYKCPAVGNYADPSNCKCFHMCYMYAGKIQEKYTCCRPGSHFSEGAQRCVAGDDC